MLDNLASGESQTFGPPLGSHPRSARLRLARSNITPLPPRTLPKSDILSTSSYLGARTEAEAHEPKLKLELELELELELKLRIDI